MQNIEITKEEIKITARVIQKLKLQRDQKSSIYGSIDSLGCLFDRVIGTFWKYYDNEEELRVIENNLEEFITTKDSDWIFDNLKYKEDIEEKRIKEIENTILLQKIKPLIWKINNLFIKTTWQ